VATVARVREADRARTGGRIVRRGRLLRLTVPILEASLERALLLAESMDARGFAGAEASRSDRLAGWCILGALAGMGGAFVALVGRARGPALVLAALAITAVVVAIVVASRQVERARYRPRRMKRTDWAVTGISLLAPAGLAALALAGDDTLTWAASPLHLPDFNPVAALALAALTVPAWRPASPAYRAETAVTTA
jgi:energy-coupling factor transport system permease protein